MIMNVYCLFIRIFYNIVIRLGLYLYSKWVLRPNFEPPQQKYFVRVTWADPLHLETQNPKPSNKSILLEFWQFSVWQHDEFHGHVNSEIQIISNFKKKITPFPIEYTNL